MVLFQKRKTQLFQQPLVLTSDEFFACCQKSAVFQKVVLQYEYIHSAFIIADVT